MEPVWELGCSDQLHPLDNDTVCFKGTAAVCTFNLKTNETTFTTEAKDASVLAVAANHERGIIAFSIDQLNSPIYMHDRQGNLMQTITSNGSYPFSSLAFCEDGHLLFAVEASPGTRLFVFDWVQGKADISASFDSPKPYKIQVNPTNWAQFVTYTHDEVILWRIDRFKSLATLAHHNIGLDLSTTERQGTRLMRRTSLEQALDLEMFFVDSSESVSVRCCVFAHENVLVCGCASGELIQATDSLHEKATVLLESSEYGQGSADALYWDEPSKQLIVAGVAGVVRVFSWKDELTCISDMSLHKPILSITKLRRAFVVSGPNHISAVPDSFASEKLQLALQGPAVNVVGTGTCLMADGTEFVVSLASSQRTHVISVHAPDGTCVSSTNVADPTVSFTCLCAAAYVPVVVAGTATGGVFVYRIAEDGSVSLISVQQVFVDERIHCISTIPTAALVVCATESSFAVLRGPSLSIAMFGRLPSRIRAVQAYMTEKQHVVSLMVDADFDYCLLSFVVPQDQKRTTDLFFSRANSVEIDFSIAPVSFARVASQREHESTGNAASASADDLSALSVSFVASASHLFIFDSILGTVSVCDPLNISNHPQKHPSVQAAIDAAPHIFINSSAHGVRGASANTALSPAGNVIAFVGALGEVQSVVLSEYGNMVVSRDTYTAFATEPNTSLALPIRSAHIAWSVDGKKLFILSPKGTFSCFEWASEGPCAANAQASIAQAQQYRESLSLQIDGANATIQKMHALAAASGVTQTTDNDADASHQAIQTTTGNAHILDKIETLKTKLAALIEENGMRDDDARLEKDEFVLDMHEKQRLEDALKTALAKRRDEIELDIVREQFLRHNIKKQCWDSMEVQGKRIYAFDTNVEVLNFPIPKVPEEEENELERVIGIRKVEIARDEALRKLGERDTSNSLDDGSGNDNEGHRDGSAAHTDGNGNEAVADNGNGDGEGDGDTADADHEDADDDTGEANDSNDVGHGNNSDESAQDVVDASSIRQYLYKPLQLTTSARRRIQITLLKHYVRELKLQYNKIFDETLGQKADEKAKIASKNEQIEKIGKELQKQIRLYKPKEHVLENPESLLTVADDEVTVERVLTEEQRLQKEEEERLEALRRAEAAKDNIHERGILDMMNGRLERSSDDDVWKDIPKPEFLINVPKTEWDEDQAREAAAYDKAHKELLELRSKRRKALEGNLRTLQSQILAIRDGFDNRLQEVFEQRITAEQTVAREELMILKLAKALQDEQDIIDEENALKTGMVQYQQKQPSLAKAVASAQNVVEHERAVLNDLVAHNKDMEKAFRMRSEFSDVDQPTLELMYKAYRGKQKRPSAPIENNLPVQPQEVSDATWRKYKKLMVEKMNHEEKIRQQQHTIAQAEEYLDRRTEDERECVAKIDRGMSALSQLRIQRSRLNMDPEVLVTVTQGQVELVHTNDFDPNFTSAVLIHRSLIEDLNESVRKLAQAKIDHITRKLKMAQGIRLLEWEHKKLDIEKEQLVHLTREVQLFKVSKDTTSKNPTNHKKEVEAAEKSIKMIKAAHGKRVEQKQQQIQKLRKDIRKKMARKQELASRVSSLASDVGERAHVRQVQLAAVGDGGMKERMALAQNRHKLVSAIRSQATEIQTLQNEVCMTCPLASSSKIKNEISLRIRDIGGHVNRLSRINMRPPRCSQFAAPRPLPFGVLLFLLTKLFPSLQQPSTQYAQSGGTDANEDLPLLQPVLNETRKEGPPPPTRNESELQVKCDQS